MTPIVTEQPLLLDDQGNTVTFKAIEISRLSFGIRTEIPLEQGQKMVLRSNQGSVPLVVTTAHADESNSDVAQYLLTAQDTNANLERALNVKVEHFVNNVSKRAGEVLARAIRFSVERELLVSSKTFGTIGAIVLQAIDISKSGLLLIAPKRQAPYIVNTILEMEIDPKGTWVKQPIRCVGKVVRSETRIEDGQTVQAFAIKIIDIDSEHLFHWEHCVAEAERALRVGLDRSA